MKVNDNIFEDELTPWDVMYSSHRGYDLDSPKSRRKPNPLVKLSNFQGNRLSHSKSDKSHKFSFESPQPYRGTIALPTTNIAFGADRPLEVGKIQKPMTHKRVVSEVPRFNFLQHAPIDLNSLIQKKRVGSQPNIVDNAPPMVLGHKATQDEKKTRTVTRIRPMTSKLQLSKVEPQNVGEFMISNSFKFLPRAKTPQATQTNFSVFNPGSRPASGTNKDFKNSMYYRYKDSNYSDFAWYPARLQSAQGHRKRNTMASIDMELVNDHQQEHLEEPTNTLKRFSMFDSQLGGALNNSSELLASPPLTFKENIFERNILNFKKEGKSYQNMLFERYRAAVRPKRVIPSYKLKKPEKPKQEMAKTIEVRATTATQSIRRDTSSSQLKRVQKSNQERVVFPPERLQSYVHTASSKNNRDVSSMEMQPVLTSYTGNFPNT